MEASAPSSARSSRLRRLAFDRPNWPFAPARLPVFYGWLIIPVATVGVLFSAPGQTIGVSVFTEDLMVTTGLTRVQISLTYLVGTLGGALLLPRAGRIYDRLGARTTTFLVGIAFGGALILLSQIDVALCLLRTLPGVGATPLYALISGFALTSVGFFALRFLGQGVLSLATSNMVMNWFDRRRGLANGFMGLLTSFGFSSAPIVFNALIAAYTWKGAWLVLGLVTFTGLTLLSALLYRDNPEECGLRPDGGNSSTDAESRDDRPDYNLDRARRTLPFWIFLASGIISSVFHTAVSFHVVSIYAEAGLDRDAAVEMFLPIATIAVSINFIAGWLSDRTSLRGHLALYLAGIVVANIGMLNLQEPWGRPLLIAGMGTTGGLMRLLGSVTWPRYYGRRNLGAIRGFVMAIGVGASAVGPTIFGLAYDLFDDYEVASWICITSASVLIPLTPWALEPPDRRR
ncbi:MAG: MFS transporter [Candidatus Latescibacterota bacterium]|nr:MFS transporter [Candidatus Latescibacterota bacterium]